MTHPDNTDLQTTPLTRWHRDNGGRMVPFAGYEMPVQYRGVLAEHAVVRDKVGLFDITHMGEILVTGADTAQWLDSLSTNRIDSLEVGKIVYTAMCRPDGGVLDDMLIYRLDDGLWMVVCNAANHAKIAAWLTAQSTGWSVKLDDISNATAMIAVQGPEALELVGRLQAVSSVKQALADLEFYTSLVLDGPGGRWIVSRTGYTGERGYELYVPNADAVDLWRELLDKGADLGVEPIGLAARDSLRFEVAYSLYGHELGEDRTPLETGIGWAVRLKNREFIGSEALRAQKTAGVPRQLIGIEIQGEIVNGRMRPAPIARQDTPVIVEGRRVGVVTSGTKSPTLDRSLALALVDMEIAKDESIALTVEIRDKRVPAVRTEIPFLNARVKGDPRAER